MSIRWERRESLLVGYVLRGGCKALHVWFDEIVIWVDTKYSWTFAGFTHWIHTTKGSGWFLCVICLWMCVCGCVFLLQSLSLSLVGTVVNGWQPIVALPQNQRHKIDWWWWYKRMFKWLTKIIGLTKKNVLFKLMRWINVGANVLIGWYFQFSTMFYF